MAPPPKKNNSTEGPILANFKIPPPRVTPQINKRGGGGKGKKLPPLFFQTWGKANSSAFRRREEECKPIVIRILPFLGPKKIWVWADIDPGSKAAPPAHLLSSTQKRGVPIPCPPNRDLLSGKEKKKKKLLFSLGGVGLVWVGGIFRARTSSKKSLFFEKHETALYASFPFPFPTLSVPPPYAH